MMAARSGVEAGWLAIGWEVVTEDFSPFVKTLGHLTIASEVFGSCCSVVRSLKAANTLFYCSSTVQAIHLPAKTCWVYLLGSNLVTTLVHNISNTAL